MYSDETVSVSEKAPILNRQYFIHLGHFLPEIDNILSIQRSVYSMRGLFLENKGAASKWEISSKN